MCKHVRGNHDAMLRAVTCQANMEASLYTGMHVFVTGAGSVPSRCCSAPVAVLPFLCAACCSALVDAYEASADPLTKVMARLAVVDGGTHMAIEVGCAGATGIIAGWHDSAPHRMQAPARSP